MPIELISPIVATSCGSCHIRFGLQKDFMEERQRDGHHFHCPNGCRLSWSENDATRAKKESDRLRILNASLMQDVERARSARKVAERQASAARGLLTKAKNRINKGICPCCNRYFRELHRHMQDKHPEWNTTDAPKS